MSKPRKHREWPTLAPDVANGTALGTIDDAATALRLSKNFVQQLNAAGVIRGVNFGKAVRFHLPSLIAQYQAQGGGH